MNQRTPHMRSPFIRFIQIFLLVLIIIGLGLIVTKSYWVPQIVSYLLKDDAIVTMNTPAPTKTATTSYPTAVISKKKIIPAKFETGVQGVVYLSPTCPVEKIPADPSCEPKRYVTSLRIKNKATGEEKVVTTTTAGDYQLQTEKGFYTVSLDGNAVYPRLQPVTFQVVDHAITVLDLNLDSGIR